MENNDSFKIRPAGRHILTIGRDLIQDKYAAIIELVKNAYDADSNDVIITFSVPKNRDKLEITVKDKGHGMTRDAVINQWLVPSTNNKLEQKISSNKKRIMQGRKGVGRYAASILGNDLLLETVSNAQKTTVYVQWKQFEQADFLEDVDILVETESTIQPDGTQLFITANKNQIQEWNRKQHENLEFELRKLISPVSSIGANLNDEFSMHLNYIGFWNDENENTSKQIEPFPIFDLYDYRISGKISSNGIGLLEFNNQKARNSIKEVIDVDIGQNTGCGSIEFDVRVYDREPEAIEQLISRGLKDYKGNYVGKLKARQLLNKYNGIGVYRNGFRIRPLGDPENDWLELDKKRVQNPSLKIGSNQVIGHIQIQSEELSGLEEKSARDGLKLNYAFSQLLKISTENVINELEKRRYIYRRKAGLSRSALKIEQEFEKIFSFEDVKEGIVKKLNDNGIDKKTTDDILNLLEKKEDSASKSIENIRQAVAIYQGQATLGKIINVVLHEGRRPLNFFNNEIKNLLFWVNQIKKDCAKDELKEIKRISEESLVNSKMLSSLFKRIDPLATGKRTKAKDFNLKINIESSLQVFEEILITSQIKYKVNCPENIIFTGWRQDIYAIITNLVDNSIFWMNEKKSKQKTIEINVNTKNNEFVYLDYLDSGPGIEPILIENEVVFEPDFSTKDGGTGIGLAIAGEAAFRNGLELKAFESDSGAYFRLQKKES